MSMLNTNYKFSLVSAYCITDNNKNSWSNHNQTSKMLSSGGRLQEVENCHQVLDFILKLTFHYFKSQFQEKNLVLHIVQHWNTSLSNSHTIICPHWSLMGDYKQKKILQNHLQWLLVHLPLLLKTLNSHTQFEWTF